VSHPLTLLALPDKFKGTATAAQVAAAIARGAAVAGWACDTAPISDGGEGLLECFGGANRVNEVSGPLGEPVRAHWRLDGPRAVIEMATASGLALVTGRKDPVRASTAGTGQLIAAAIDAGATEIVVGAGGSASTDGGRGAVDVLQGVAPLDGSRGYRVTVAVDVGAQFLDAAALFAPQKGAGAAEVTVLARRLREQAADYLARFGVDVTAIDGSGAAGGLAGGLAALGATLQPGFALVSDTLDLPARISRADLVITGEGRYDRSSLLGKAPHAVTELCRRTGTPVALLVGEVAPDVTAPPHTMALVTRFGMDAALEHPLDCVEAAVPEMLAARAQLVT
jgi:glycerate 2-kinase